MIALILVTLQGTKVSMYLKIFHLDFIVVYPSLALQLSQKFTHMESVLEYISN